MQAAGATYRQSGGNVEGIVQLVHPTVLHQPADGKFQFLKGTEEDQVVTDVIRAASVGWSFGGSPTSWTQVAGKEKLWTSIPTVFQQNIVVFLQESSSMQ